MYNTHQFYKTSHWSLSFNIQPWKPVILILHVCIFTICQITPSAGQAGTRAEVSEKAIPSFSRRKRLICVGQIAAYECYYPHICCNIQLKQHRKKNVKNYNVISVPTFPPQLNHIFSTLPHKRHDFRVKVMKHQTCYNFCTTNVWNISHSKKKYRIMLLLSLFNYNWVDTRWQQYSTNLHKQYPKCRGRNIQTN
jgi:hypothetical protein